jgi:alpha-beta hydrolase superfamily lysophospholipase
MTPTLPRRAFLGAELPGDADAFTADGVRIAGVHAGTMAAHALLAAGDVLIELAGHPVRSLAELAAALRAAGRADAVELVYLRHGVRHAVRADVVPMPGEPDAAYGAFASAGALLRTIETLPASPRGLVLFLQGIACESVDHALDPDAPLATLVAAWTSAGYATLRFDKRGVGDSEGDACRTTDFTTELADARAALAYAASIAQARGLPLYLFGHSVGGIIAAQLAHDVPVAGIMVYGSPVTRWLDCLLDSVERQLQLRGADRAEIDAQRAAIENLAQTGELNGRSAAYHAQLHALDLEAAWRRVQVPVLVLRGEHDWVVRADDQAHIAELVTGATTLVDLPGLDHLFGAHADREASLRDYGAGRASDSLARATLDWLAAR